MTHSCCNTIIFNGSTLGGFGDFLGGAGLIQHPQGPISTVTITSTILGSIPPATSSTAGASSTLVESGLLFSTLSTAAAQSRSAKRSIALAPVLEFHWGQSLWLA